MIRISPERFNFVNPLNLILITPMVKPILFSHYLDINMPNLSLNWSDRHLHFHIC
jgi:hypothetical protein